MKKFYSLLVFLFLASTAFANNLQISNVSVVNQNVPGGYTYLQFTISWENSWRDGENWDAAWIFIKYQLNANSEWQHATLGNTSQDHVAPQGSQIDAPTDGLGKGIFIYRSFPGSGTNNFQNVRIKWNYGLDGLASNTYTNIKVFGIEMVYIPTSSFYVGDTYVDSFQLIKGNFCAGSQLSNVFQITSENQLTLGGTSLSNLGSYNPNFDDFSSTTTQTLPAAFPKGYNKFYLMKYETTQEQYVDFLNTVPASIINTDSTFFPNMNSLASYPFTNTNNPIRRNGIKKGFLDNGGIWPYFYCDLNNNGIPNEIDDGQNLPVNYISPARARAYLGWAGLRPMTELEYEKASNGPLYPVPGQYSWGSPRGYHGTLLNKGRPDEATGGNSNLTDSIVYRVGAAANSNTTRESSGASFYGVMNLGDNAEEWTYCINEEYSRGMTSNCGTGHYFTSTVSNIWMFPPVNSYWAAGWGLRGGSISSEGHLGTVANRIDVQQFSFRRDKNYRAGFRGARTF